MPSTLLIAAILALLGITPTTTSNDRADEAVARANVVYAATPAGPNGLWNNVRFGLPRVPRPRPPMPHW